MYLGRLQGAIFGDRNISEAIASYLMTANREPRTDSMARHRLQDLIPQLYSPEIPPGDPYLRFDIDAKTSALLAMESAREALVLPAERITPMPNLPPQVLGLFDLRGQIVWAIDLAMVLGLRSAPEFDRRTYSIIAARTHERDLLFGWAIHRLRPTVRLLPEELRSPVGEFPEAWTPYLRGCVLQGDRRWLVLDAEALARVPLQSGPAGS